MASDLVRLAYQRVKVDNEWRVFYRHPFELRLVDVSPADWAREIEQAVDAATYVADPAPSLEVPKAGWNIRPGLALSIRDQLAYHYASLRAATRLGPLLDWSAYTVRFSYRLTMAGKAWFEREFQGWRSFDTVSLGKISGGAKYIVVADIAGYYDNIDIGRLVTELDAAQVDRTTRDQLSKLWNKWAGVRARGIPQACAPSHVFGEFFLDPVDRGLRAYGIEHIRYLDDIRIFTPSKRRARLHLHELSRLLRDRGLNLQTAKTEILSAAAAKARFSSVHKYLTKVSRKIAAELAALGSFDDYGDPEEVRRFLATDPENPPPEVVERAWKSFVDGELGGFDKTVFHYLLRRHVDLGSPGAAEWSLNCVLKRPEETGEVLRYLADVCAAVPAHVVDKLAAILSSDEVLYEYQRYLVLRWFYEQRVAHPAVIEYARSRVGPNAHPLLRPHAIAYLGDHGETADFGRLERALRDEVSAISRATLLIALRREAGPIRNTWYGRCAGESSLVDRALKLAKSL